MNRHSKHLLVTAILIVASASAFGWDWPWSQAVRDVKDASSNLKQGVENATNNIKEATKNVERASIELDPVALKALLNKSETLEQEAVGLRRRLQGKSGAHIIEVSEGADLVLQVVDFLHPTRFSATFDSASNPKIDITLKRELKPAVDRMKAVALDIRRQHQDYIDRVQNHPDRNSDHITLNNDSTYEALLKAVSDAYADTTQTTWYLSQQIGGRGLHRVNVKATSLTDATDWRVRVELARKLGSGQREALQAFDLDSQHPSMTFEFDVIYQGDK